ncbi:uncharacterized protein LOC106440406 isoform X2 [Brassica napus]|uniref:uncharacterized protein LOC106440406 isoform X2 n=1 Tax=Brassica napus TaxID=3708 RepID=UPI0020788468|nr:uncharacterized protein LOC106440406 isoform X2 [Brassica napus]
MGFKREAKEVINAVVLKVRKQRNLHDCFFSLFPGGRGTMWSATLAFPSLVASSTSLSCCRNRRLPKIQASLSSYPLASKIMICRFRQVKIFYKRSFQLLVRYLK